MYGRTSVDGGITWSEGQLISTAATRMWNAQPGHIDAALDDSCVLIVIWRVFSGLGKVKYGRIRSTDCGLNFLGSSLYVLDDAYNPGDQGVLAVASLASNNAGTFVIVMGHMRLPHQHTHCLRNVQRIQE